MELRATRSVRHVEVLNHTPYNRVHEEGHRAVRNLAA